VIVASDALVMMERDGTILCREGARLVVSHPAHLLLAAEPVARLLPIPGWTLPGVSTLADAVPDGGVTWIAARRARLAEAAAVLPLANQLALDEVSDVAAEGTERLVSIRFRDASGPQRAAADRLVLHDGVVPAVQQTRALGCAHRWDEVRRAWEPVTTPDGATTRAGVWAATAGPASGRTAVRAVARALGHAVAAGMDLALSDDIPPLVVTPADTTVVCRCEGVTAGAVRAAARLGCLGMNQLKVFTRCGMGICQGRDCGAMAAAVLAAARGVPEAEVAPMRVRFPLVPVTLGALAALDLSL
jgi:bacterioferritin-associated ferredoxin